LIAGLRDSNASPELVRAGISGLRMNQASLDSDYYDLLEEYRRLEGHTDARVRRDAVLARMHLRDETVLQQALAMAENDVFITSILPDYLEVFGDDSVTTLCLMAEGKYLSCDKKKTMWGLRR
jgi:hypothetical protein